MDETGGTAKGSLKDRLRVLNILIRIAKKKKMNLWFDNVNAKKIIDINRLYMFFYTPAKVILPDKLKVSETTLYGEPVSENMTLVRNKDNFRKVDLFLIRRPHKKGINYIEELKEHQNQQNANEELQRKLEELRQSVGIITEKEIEALKSELSSKYHIDKSKISVSLIRDYLAIKNRSEELFDAEINDNLKEALIIDRIKAENSLQSVKSVTGDLYLEQLHDGDFKVDTASLKGVKSSITIKAGDVFLARDIDYDLKLDSKSLEKLNKMLEEQKKELEAIDRKIDQFDIVSERKVRLTNTRALISGTIGLGIGLLTLPFSFCRTFALGANMIRNSLNSINHRVSLNQQVRKVRNYRISVEDIETVDKALRSSDYLLEDTLDKLDHLKYKIKHYEYKLPDASEKLQEIALLEKGLTKKKEELTKAVESLEKHKAKVLTRPTT